MGGNLFGTAAPIVTGYVVAATGGYSGAFAIAGVLLLGGAAIIISGARSPIRLEAAPTGQTQHRAAAAV
jgi:ACS family glucarate transporter-like MFS transporter